MTLRLKIILSLLIVITSLVLIFGTIKLVSYISKRLAPPVPTQDEIAPGPKQDYFDTQSQPTPEVQPDVQTERLPTGQVSTEPQTAPQIPTKPTQQISQVQTDLVTFVLPFTERFGTYSNQSNYENLEDLLAFMTRSFKQTTRERIETARSVKPTSLYKGVTTRALSADIVSIDEKNGSAVAIVKTQRKEVVGSNANLRTTQQNLRVTFAKEDGMWLVANAVWQ
mgnify:CR=1 FL=1